MGLNTNRRKHERFEYEANISHDIMSLEIVHAGKIYNFSDGGLYFESDQTLYPGEEIYIWVGKRPQIHDDESQLFFGVEIIWHKDLQDSSYRYGYGAKLIKTNDPSVRGMNISKFERKRQQNSQRHDGLDSRKCHRRLYNKPFLFTYQNRRHKGYITNISRGGAFVETKSKLSLGRIIILAIPGSKNHKVIKIKGWIVRLNKEGVGVKFEQRSGRERRSDLDRRIGLERRSRGKRKGQSNITG